MISADEKAPILIPICRKIGAPAEAKGSRWETRTTIKYETRQVNEEEMTEMILVFMAILLNSPSMMKNRPRTTKKGVPGGWGTPRILALAINSPQYQNDRVGAMVLKKTMKGIRRLKPPSRIEAILTDLSLLSNCTIMHLLKYQTLKIPMSPRFVKL